MEGHLTGFSLQAFLQVVEAEGKTCSLRVSSGPMHQLPASSRNVDVISVR